MLNHVAAEFARYRVLAEGAMAQVPDDALNRVVAPDGNSIAMIVRHISGNLMSRFTNFFMKKFQRLGFIDYKDGLRVNKSLLTVILHD